jgi:hypothetical protein
VDSVLLKQIADTYRLGGKRRDRAVELCGGGAIRQSVAAVHNLSLAVSFHCCCGAVSRSPFPFTSLARLPFRFNN